MPRRRIFRIPSLACAAAVLERSAQGAPQEAAQAPPPGALVIDAADTYYLLNPDGDLAPTQQAFESWFASLRGWQVTEPYLWPAVKP